MDTKQFFSRRTILILVAILSLPRLTIAQSQNVTAVVGEAFTYAFPVFEIARVRYQSITATGVGVNHLSHLRRLADYRDRWVTTPNNDTLYSSAFLDLSHSPVEIATPDFHDRYFSIAFLDAYSNNFSTVGRRTTGTAPQHFLVVGPDWQGTAPKGIKLIRAPGNWVWVLVRILIQEPDDLAAVHHLQDALVLRPLEPVVPEPVPIPVADDADSFIAVVNRALAANPPPPADWPVLERIARAGIVPGGGLPDADLRAAWKAQLPLLKARLREALPAAQAASVRRGWSYNPTHLGNFGTDYAYRALVALAGLAALEPAEAVYSSAATDQNGEPLRGDRRYRWHLPSEGLPVDAFWSLSAYEVTVDGALFFADNPIHRYAIGDRTAGLVRNADGGLDILIQHQPPADAANWLPIPDGPVGLVLRAYQPRPSLLKGEYRFPVIERLP